MTGNESTRRTHARLGLFLTTIGGILYSFDLPLLRLSLADQWTMVAARGLLLFVSVSMIWWVMRKMSGERTPFLDGTAGIAVAATSTVASIAYISAIVTTNAANVVFIMALVPVLTALLSWLFIGERIYLFTWIAMINAILGVSIIVSDSAGAGTVWGDIMALISALGIAAAFTIIRASRKNLVTSIAVGNLASAVIALAFFNVSLPSVTATALYGVPAWFWLGLNGLVAIPLASMLIANAPRFLPSADVSMFFLLETILTPIWIWMLVGEVPSYAVLVGGFVIVFTLVAHGWWRLTLAPEPEPS